VWRRRLNTLALLPPFTLTLPLSLSISLNLPPPSAISMDGMHRCSANYSPLTPITFLERSAAVYGERLSLVHGTVRYTWTETLQRCTRLASALVDVGISRRDVTTEELPRVVIIKESDQQSSYTNGFDSSSDDLEFERLLGTGKLDFEIRRPQDEDDPISLNYTSGTTSRPKGVIYSH
ncbi:putative acyl-activating enzyme 21, partial [Cucurbita argyrosperma subsp. argyrosperma]